MQRHRNQPKAPAAPRQAGAPLSADGERVAKALARAGVASRREVERFIHDGRVALNGEVLTSPAVKVGAHDVLTVDGAPVGAAEATRVWRYHKPPGLLTTHSDPKGRPTVFDHLPDGLPRVISVGRLDLNSEGLLLLTNDGGLARALELPSNGWVRQYRARAFGRVDQPALDRLKDGITVEGVRYGPIEARLDKAQRRAGEAPDGPANAWITLKLAEGKNREVRRVLEALGLRVNRLVRLAYGPFALGTLEIGVAEEVGPRVIGELLAPHIAPESRPGAGVVPPPLARPKPVATQPQRPRGRPAAAVPPPQPDAGAEAAVRKVYKAGWAKPKVKARMPAAPKGPKPTAASPEPPARRKRPQR